MLCPYFSVRRFRWNSKGVALVMQATSLSRGQQTDESLAILVEASEIVAGHSLDLDSLLSELVALIRKVVEYQLVAVLLKSGESTLRIQFASGYSDDVVRNMRIKIGEGITGAAGAEMQTVIANDVRDDPRYVEAIEDVRSEIAVPLMARGKLVGVIDVQAPEPNAFGDNERKLLELIGSRFSLAIDAAQLYRATLRQNRTLRTLSEIAQQFNRILNLDELLKKISGLVRTIIPYDAFSILLLEEGGDVLKHYFGVRYDERIQWETLKLGQGIVGAAALTKQPVLVRDTSQDERYVAAIEGIRSEVAVPLMIKDEVIGVIDLECETVGAFTAEHQRTLMLLAPTVAAAIENARLYEEVERNKVRLESDLTAARTLQQHLLSSAKPEFEGIEIAVRNDAATEVTGDLYDFFPFPGDQLDIVIGDVSGKGAAAALYAALASGLLRNLVKPDSRSTVLLKKLNQALLARRVEARYLTALFAQWHPSERRLVVANAGQPRPIVRRNGQVDRVAAEGVPLGLLEGTSYEALTLDLEPGDVVILVSDGITETRQASGSEYDETRLIEVVRGHPGASAGELVQAIFDDVNAFSSGARQEDDRTVIALKITA